MKKTFILSILLLFLLIPALAQEIGENTGFFSPPEWLIGTWADESGEMIFRFEEHNVVQTSPDHTDFDEVHGSDMCVCFIDTSCASQYTYTVLIPSAFMNVNYDFKNIQDNVLEFVFTNNDVVTSMVMSKKGTGD